MRFKQDAGEKAYLIPVGNHALDIAASEYHATPQANKAEHFQRELSSTKHELEQLSEKLARAQAHIKELEAIVHSTKSIRKEEKEGRYKQRKRYRKLQEILLDEKMLDKTKIKKLMNTLTFWLAAAEAEEVPADHT